MISKELLSAVLKTVDNVCEVEKIGNAISYKHLLSTGFFAVNHINIHELAHMVKEWAIKHNFWICSQVQKNNSWCELMSEGIDGPVLIEFTADTEPEAIFKAGEWILNDLH